MISEALKSVLFEAFSPPEEQREKYEYTIHAILSKLDELGYRIIKPDVLSATDIDGLERTILAWISNPDVEQGDINGESVIHALTQAGWTVAPPLQ